MESKNIILLAEPEISIGNLEILKDLTDLKLLYYGVENLDTLERHFYVNENSKPFVLLREKYHFYLQIQRVEDILYNLDYLKKFISKFLNNQKDDELSFTQQSIKLYLFRNNPEITIDTILNDIKFLEHTNKVTSRLAIFIYKISNFYCSASDKEIGIHYAKYFGRSSLFSNKRFKITNTKGYYIKDMPDKQEYNIKVDIAEYLLKYSNCNIDILSEATQLDIKTLEELR